MVMRVGGLATGMDIEAMVNKLMSAERMPLTRMQQDHTKLTWQRDAFREINRALLELDEMMLDMRLGKTYHAKSVRSTQADAVTATGTAQASNGMYEIEVTKLAKNAINMSAGDEPVIQTIDESYFGETFEFYTFDGNGKKQTHEFTVHEGDTVDDVLKRITDANNDVRAFYDGSTQKVILETTRTGKYNNESSDSEDYFNGAEIGFDSSNTFFREVLKLRTENEKGGTDAEFTYNNEVNLTSKDNFYHLHGINFEFNNVTNGNARLTVSNDVDHTFDAIVKFVDKYNEVIEKLNATQQEEVYRDFKPLTDEQKKEMSEDEIKKWEEKAMSGILRREGAITDGMYSMRQSWYAGVATGGEYTSLTQIGITTSSKYLDGGKLEIDEDDLRTAIRNNPEDVRKLFANSNEDESRGIIHRLQDSVRSTMGKIEQRAGKDYHTLENYALGKQMKYLDKRISDFGARMVRVENRYWNQFTQMEKAIQRLNDQSAQLFSQFGGM